MSYNVANPLFYYMNLSICKNLDSGWEISEMWLAETSLYFSLIWIIIQHIDTLPKYGQKNSRCT